MDAESDQLEAEITLLKPRLTCSRNATQKASLTLRYLRSAIEASDADIRRQQESLEKLCNSAS